MLKTLGLNILKYFAHSWEFNSFLLSKFRVLGEFAGSYFTLIKFYYDPALSRNDLK